RVPDIPVQVATIRLENVAISRSSLVDHQEIRVTAVGSAAVSLTVTATGLSVVAGLPVTIAPNGQTYLDKTPVDRSQLSQALAQYLQQNPKGMVVLNASPNAFYNEVIQVLDIMRAVGGDRVALATTPNPSASPGADPSQPGDSPFPTPSPTFSPFDPFNTPVPGSNPSSPKTAPGGTGSSGFDIFGTPSPKTPDR
ncbi:MAG: biopolymer transporter ExbD, partial [Leptodesmis sp.]|uniref:ExbD/TolR family protein n=1 Tax=Leptodesmis sp. TaxID=3100501 RepID=UPI003D0BE754